MSTLPLSHREGSPISASSKRTRFAGKRVEIGTGMRSQDNAYVRIMIVQTEVYPTKLDMWEYFSHSHRPEKEMGVKFIQTITT